MVHGFHSKLFVYWRLISPDTLAKNMVPRVRNCLSTMLRMTRTVTIIEQIGNKFTQMRFQELSIWSTAQIAASDNNGVYFFDHWACLIFRCDFPMFTPNENLGKSSEINGGLGCPWHGMDDHESYTIINDICWLIQKINGYVNHHKHPSTSIP